MRPGSKNDTDQHGLGALFRDVKVSLVEIARTIAHSDGGNGILFSDDIAYIYANSGKVPPCLSRPKTRQTRNP